ncbi:MAG: hypothetical protein ACK5OB_18815 [Pirellula sp.]|jgi:hypothetical protein
MRVQLWGEAAPILQDRLGWLTLDSLPLTLGLKVGCSCSSGRLAADADKFYAELAEDVRDLVNHLENRWESKSACNDCNGRVQWILPMLCTVDGEFQ